VRLRGRGDRALILKLIKIGIKDAGAGGYIDARATVSVTRTPSGSLLEATQETPVALGRESQHVVFDNDTFVHVQTPLRELEAGIDAAGGDVSFVIELRHFKPKKKKTSVKGWCFFSLSELDLSRQTTQLSLEVYAKPTDLRCKKMSLLSVKELYAHVDVIVHTE
jgi:ketosteroid isomerase-like protein